MFNDKRRRSPGAPGATPPARAGLLLATAVLAGALGAGCGGSPAEQAAAALEAGLQAHQAGDLAEAARQYELCLGLDPVSVPCLYDLGVVRQAQQQPEAAENYYRLALAQDPAHESALYNLAIVRTGLGDAPGATALYRQVIAVNPGRAAAHFNLALLLGQAGDLAGAEAEFGLAFQLDPSLVPPEDAPLPGPGATPAP